MTDREKAIKGLEHCKKTLVCNGCPYAEEDTPEGFCPVYDDAIALLRGQEPVVATWYQVDGVLGFADGYKCGECNAEIERVMRYCPYCGRKVKWND